MTEPPERRRPKTTRVPSPGANAAPASREFPTRNEEHLPAIKARSLERPRKIARARRQSQGVPAENGCNFFRARALGTEFPAGKDWPHRWSLSTRLPCTL